MSRALYHLARQWQLDDTSSDPAAQEQVWVTYGPLQRHKAERCSGGDFPSYTSRVVYFSSRRKLADLEQALRNAGLHVIPAMVSPSRWTPTTVVDPPALTMLPRRFLV